MRKLITLIFCVCAGAVQAAEIDFSVVLQDVSGQSYKDCMTFDDAGKCSKIVDLTLGHFSAGVLNARTPNMTVQQLVERGQLASRLYKGGKQTVSVDDIKLIKDSLPTTNFPPLEILVAIQLLDPDSLTPKK